MPECRTCGAHISADAVRVLYPSGVTHPERCPNCSVRRNGTYRARRYDREEEPRSNAQDPGDAPDSPTLAPREVPDDE